MSDHAKYDPVTSRMTILNLPPLQALALGARCVRRLLAYIVTSDKDAARLAEEVSATAEALAAGTNPRSPAVDDLLSQAAVVKDQTSLLRVVTCLLAEACGAAIRWSTTKGGAEIQAVRHAVACLSFDVVDQTVDVNKAAVEGAIARDLEALSSLTGANAGGLGLPVDSGPGGPLGPLWPS